MVVTQVQTYPIAETFHSLQGEGAWAGTSAFFIRLAGCDVHCPWCDQKETWNARRYPLQSVTELGELAQSCQPAIVVITGGEPLMYDLTALTKELKKRGLRRHLETSGAYDWSGDFDWVTFSPKTYKLPKLSIYEKVSELKVVISNTTDFSWAEQQALCIPSTALQYLQPEWNYPESQALIVNYILQHPQWRLSLQSHKFLGVR
ncbi:MAG: 7-carboxy-7-deazaguanine synthase QueE [Snowella sp.]|nr:7-carboxy-7-deazaguanine synthase QueE [Snowella sp.]